MGDNAEEQPSASSAAGSDSRSPLSAKAAVAGSPLKTTAAVAASEMPEDGQPSLYDKIAKLKADQKAAREAKRVATKELRNAQRKKSRVMAKARELSNRDLAEVITLRQEAAKAKAKQKKEEQSETGDRAGAPGDQAA